MMTIIADSNSNHLGLIRCMANFIGINFLAKKIKWLNVRQDPKFKGRAEKKG